MEQSDEQRNLQKEEYKSTPDSQPKISFIGNDAETNKKWINYGAGQIRYAKYLSNGAISRGTIPEHYRTTDSAESLIDWKMFTPVPFSLPANDNADEITQTPVSIVLIQKSTKTPIAIALIQANKKIATSIILIQKKSNNISIIALVAKSELKTAYIALLELQTEYVYIYNPEVHSCDRIPVSELIQYHDVYKDYEECKEDKKHCSGGLRSGGGGGSDGFDSSIAAMDSIIENHPGWEFTVYIAHGSRVIQHVNPASIWYNGTIAWPISEVHNSGKPGNPVVAPSNSPNYRAFGNQPSYETIYNSQSELIHNPCDQGLIPENVTDYEQYTGFYIYSSGGSKDSVREDIKKRPLLNFQGGSSTECLDHGYFFSDFQLAPVGSQSFTEVFPYRVTGYLAYTSKSTYDKPSTNRFFPGGESGGESGWINGEPYCGNYPSERKNLWREYSLLFEGKKFNSGLAIPADDTNPANNHKFVLGIETDEILLKIWHKMRSMNRLKVLTTFYLNKADLSIKSKKIEIASGFVYFGDVDYRFYHASGIQNDEIVFDRTFQTTSLLYRDFIDDFLPKIFERNDSKITFVPYNHTYGYYSSKLIKGTLNPFVEPNSDLIIDIYSVSPSSLVNGITLKEHIIKSNELIEQANIIIPVVRYRRIKSQSGDVFVLKTNRIERLNSLQPGFGITDQESYNIARIAGVYIYV
jgi:hypothetical protein